MSDKKFKKVLTFMFGIFIIAILILFFVSDRRDQSVKEVENEFGIEIPKGVKRERELYKELDFHGDGEAAILFSAGESDIKAVEKELKDYRVINDKDKEAAIETCYKEVCKRGFDPSLSLDNKKYFKETSNYKFGNAYGNFIAIIIDEEKNEILFLKWDTWF